jgi:hypothetical protein
MRTLHEGFANAAKRRFLPSPRTGDSSRPTEYETEFQTDARPGVTIHVIGPSHDRDVIRDMDPPAGQSYLRSLDLMADGSANPPPNPFRPDWWVEPADYQSMSSHLLFTVADRQKMKEIDLQMEQAVTTSLDKAVNGTSLMLMFQIGDAFLLFPGDAQWGTWQIALRNPNWLDLLKRTIFYKIGHHGSHNATPVDFVERILGENVWALVSTGAKPQWPQIPRQPLLDAIGKHTPRLTRSDRLPQVGAGATANGDLYADIKIPFIPH